MRTYTPIRSSVRGRELDVLLDMSSLPTPKRWSQFSWLRVWYHASVLRLLLAEFRSFAFRIAKSLEIREELRRGCMGSNPPGNSLASVGRPQIRAYMQYTQRLQTQFPHLTVFDWRVAEQSWVDGSAWNDHTHTSRIQNIHHSSANPVDGNSMPQKVVQQSTKRDPLTPLPSRA